MDFGTYYGNRNGKTIGVPPAKTIIIPRNEHWGLPGVEPIIINEEEFRQEFWQGRTEGRGREKRNALTHPELRRVP